VKHKLNVILWLVTVTTTLVSVATFNYIIDPLWTFSHSNILNNRQPGFNERQQKTNRAYFSGLKNYDTLMLGSSRTAYINQYDFKGMRVFNYAADNMMPYEYVKWIDIAKSIKGGEFKTIIIGIDFFGTAENYDNFIKKYYNGKEPEDYLKKSKESLYRLKTLLSIDSLKHSIESVERLRKPTISDYDRKNVRHCSIKVSEDVKKRNIASNIREYNKPLIKEYIYRKDWKKLLIELKNRNPNTNFIIFTTPVSEPFFEKFIFEAKHIDDYAKWLEETVDVFGKVYHFMDLNSITMNLDNFFDAHHIYAEGVRWIAHRISGYKTDEIPEDFGKVLTRANLQDYLSRLEFRQNHTR